MIIGQTLYSEEYGKLTVAKKAYSAVKNAVVWYGVDEKGREHVLDGTETENAPAKEVKVSDMDKIVKAIRVKKGEKGDKGDKGDIGFRGEKGEKGDKGDKGDKGEPGNDGEDGKDGKDGKQGIQGVKGEAGKDGKDGKNGKKGDKGEPGLNGLSGGGGIHEIKHATDVDYSPRTATNGQALVWNSETKKWEPGTVAGGSGSGIVETIVAGNNIDVDATDPANPIVSVETLTVQDITGTKAQFDTALTDGDFLYVGDVTQYTDELAQDAVGTILTDSSEIDFTYNDGVPSITASIVTGSIDETKLDASTNASLDLADSSVQLAFKTIAVSGQSDVIADSPTDTLNLVAGTNVTITTDASTDSVTINSTGGSGSGDVVGPASAIGDTVPLFDGVTGKLIKDSELTLSGTNTGDQDLSGLVPYSGASGDVNLGNVNLIIGASGALRFDQGGADQVDINVSAGNLLSLTGSASQALLDMESLTSPRTYEFPDKSGTFAMLDDITGGSGITSVVAGNNIDVDATDPLNPVVSVETLTLADVSDVTASTAEVNVLDGIPGTLTATELGYVDGVTSAIQTQLDAKLDDSQLDTDGTLSANSDSKIASQKATKTYVDAVAQGLSVKGSVLLATAAALPANTYLAGVITITATGTLTVDGTVTALNDRILVKDEVAQLGNGIYKVTTAGAIGVAAVLTRSTDMDIAAEFPGAFCFVESGTVNTAAGFVCTNSTPPTVGTTAITFTQFSGAGEITAGAALTKTANTLDVAVDNSSIEVNADALRVKASGITSAMLAGSIDATKLADGSVTSTELQYIGGLISDAQTQLDAKVAKSTYDAHTVLYATSDNTPVALTVGEQTLVGRVTAGNISAIAIDSDLSSVSGSDDTIPSAKATKAMGDLKLPLTGGTMTGPITLGENASIALDPAGSADGKYTGITVTGVAGYAQAFGDLVYLDPTDSRWEQVDANSASGADGDARGMLALVVSTGTDGTACTLLLQGIIRADAKFPALTINNPIYVSETAGAVTQTQPTTTDAVIRIIGAAMTADEMYFNPDWTYITHT